MRKGGSQPHGGNDSESGSDCRRPGSWDGQKLTSTPLRQVQVYVCPSLPENAKDLTGLGW